MTNPRRWIYDLEVYPNLFLICFKNANQFYTFQISPFKDEREKLLHFLASNVKEMIGFNNQHYDYPVLDHAITQLWGFKPEEFCHKLHTFSNLLIEEESAHYANNTKLKQIDLYKIHHFDNKAKSASLKLLEFNMRMDNIAETPFEFDKALQENQIEQVEEYCKNDVLATEKLYFKSIAEIELREKLSKKYGKDFTNYSSPRIGETILIMEIVKKLGADIVYEYEDTGYGSKKRVPRNTKREFVVVKDTIFPYIQFQTEPFDRLLQYFKSKVIYDMRNAFVKLPLEELEILKPFYKENLVREKQKNLNLVYKGFQYDFGAGGIHGVTKPGIYESNEEYEIIDIDISSFYPNLAIQNRYYPAHLGEEFCDIYESIYEERKKYGKGTVENLAYKLALNGAYGKSNSAFSPLYDMQYTVTTTINGQLLICMLCESIVEELNDVVILQVNTDGITVKVHVRDMHMLWHLCYSWEEMSKLKLEYAFYKKMIIKDVNNYMAVKGNGQVKRKGTAFIYDESPSELELHKDFSMLAVQKAAEAFFIHGTPPEEFLAKHDNVYDFFKRTKLNKGSYLISRTHDEQGDLSHDYTLQRITRYIVSGRSLLHKERRYSKIAGEGETLIKLMPSLKHLEGAREINLESGWLCTPLNDLSKFDEDYIKGLIFQEYYVAEAKKIIDSVLFPINEEEQKLQKIQMKLEKKQMREQMRLQKEQEKIQKKEQMRIKREQMRIQKEQMKEQMKIQKEQMRIKKEQEKIQMKIQKEQEKLKKLELKKKTTDFKMIKPDFLIDLTNDSNDANESF